MHYVITFLMTRLLLVCIFLFLQYLKRNRSVMSGRVDLAVVCRTLERQPLQAPSNQNK